MYRKVVYFTVITFLCVLFLVKYFKSSKYNQDIL